MRNKRLLKKNRPSTKRTWLERRYGFSTIPQNYGKKKFERLAIHALQRRQEVIIRTIISDLPVQSESIGLVALIMCFYEDFLEEAFIAGLHPDTGTCFLSLVDESPEYTKLGLKYGADITKATSGGEVALGFAVAHGHTDVVEILLDAGADINIVENHSNGDRMTPLDCTFPDQELYEYLRSQGALHHHEIEDIV